MVSNPLLVPVHIPLLERLDCEVDSEGCDPSGNSQDCASLSHLRCFSGTGLVAEEPEPGQPVAVSFDGREGLDSLEGALLPLSGVDYALCHIDHLLRISWNISVC